MSQNGVDASNQGDDRDDRVNRLCDIVEKFLERDLRRETSAQTQSPPPPPTNENNDKVAERFQKLNPPIFEGGVDSKVAENWIRTIERIFSYGRIPDGCKVSCASFYLRDAASYWWDTVVSVQDTTTITWERFRELFEIKYITKAARVAKRKEFANLKQGDMSVDEYIRKFEELSRYAPHLVSTNELKIEQFVEGLNPEIFRDVTVNETEGTSFARVVEQALKAERAQSKICEAMREKEAKEKEVKEKEMKEKLAKENAAKEKETKEREEREKQGMMPFKPNFHPGRRFQLQWNQGYRRPDTGGHGQGQGQGRGQGQGQAQAQKGNQEKRFKGNNNQGQSFEPFQKPQCPKCGRFHVGICMEGPNACYQCGKLGHFAKDCKVQVQELGRVPARVFALSQAQVDASPSVVSGDDVSSLD